MVPIIADVFEGQPELLALAGRQRRCAEVDGIRVRSASLKNIKRYVFRLRDLAERVLKIDVDHRVRDGLVTDVGNRAIEISNGRTDKVFGGTHLHIGELQIGSVGVRPAQTFRMTA